MAILLTLSAWRFDWWIPCIEIERARKWWCVFAKDAVVVQYWILLLDVLGIRLALEQKVIRGFKGREEVGYPWNLDAPEVGGSSLGVEIVHRFHASSPGQAASEFKTRSFVAA
jgi:hypothetical protein